MILTLQLLSKAVLGIPKQLLRNSLRQYNSLHYHSIIQELQQKNHYHSNSSLKNRFPQLSFIQICNQDDAIIESLKSDPSIIPIESFHVKRQIILSAIHIVANILLMDTIAMIP